jgi:adenosylmethionine-8-amino-7-oxononanoate aminotransferase
MISANSSYIARDLAHVWHPCTQMKDHEHELPLIPIGTMFACEQAGMSPDFMCLSKGLPHVGEVRQRGMIVAIELAADKAARLPYRWEERRGLRVYRHALERGVLLRPIGNVVYFMPPYVIQPEEIDLMVEVAREGIEAATCE